MKKHLLISITIFSIFSFNNVNSQTKLNIISKFYSNIHKDTIGVKIVSINNIENQINDSLFFFDINTKNTQISGTIKVKKNIKKNKIYFYIPINPTWHVNNKNCFNISLLFIYDPIKGVIKDVSCIKTLVATNTLKFNTEQGILDVIKFCINNYIKF